MWRCVVITMLLQTTSICSTRGNAIGNPTPPVMNKHYRVSNNSVQDKLASHIPSQGFQYFVKFPRKPTNKESNRSESYHNYSEDNINAESIQITGVIQVGKGGYNTMKQSTTETNEVKRCETDTSLSQNYLPPETSTPVAVYENPPYELDFPNKEISCNSTNHLTGLTSPCTVTVTTEQSGETVVDTISEGSNSVDTKFKIKTPNEGIVTKNHHLNQNDLHNFETPETFSMVKITGSVFTEEGLPALGSKELPVDYHFFYNIVGDPLFGHEEKRLDGKAEGRYWMKLADGRVQEVIYTADQDGYRPTITYRSGEVADQNDYSPITTYRSRSTADQNHYRPLMTH